MIVFHLMKQLCQQKEILPGVLVFALLNLYSLWATTYGHWLKEDLFRINIISILTLSLQPDYELFEGQEFDLQYQQTLLEITIIQI